MHRQIQAMFLSVLLPALFVPGLPARAQAQTHAAPEAKRLIVVSLQDRRLALLEDGQVKKIYVVAVGKQSTPSPTGTFMIMSRVSNPVYSHAGKVVQPGLGNPLGTRWMGLSVKGYGIHGTNAPGSIGKAASHGCIRMGKADVEELFAAVRARDEVEIVGERDEETAEIFGKAQAPDVVQTAQLTPVAAAPVGQ